MMFPCFEILFSSMKSGKRSLHPSRALISSKRRRRRRGGGKDLMFQKRRGRREAGRIVQQERRRVRIVSKDRFDVFFSSFTREVGGQGEVGTGVPKWFAAGSDCGRCGHSFRPERRSDCSSPKHVAHESSGSGPHHHQHHYDDDDVDEAAAGAAGAAVVAAAAAAVLNRHCKAEVGTAGSRRRRAAGLVTFPSAWCDIFWFVFFFRFIHSFICNGGC